MKVPLRDTEKNGDRYLVRYYMEGFRQPQRDNVYDALIDLSNRVCIDFKEVLSINKVDNIIHMKGPSMGASCSMYIGRNSDGSPQTMKLGRGCIQLGIVQHEMLHALGMDHEHNRPDRDVQWLNIEVNSQLEICLIPIF